MSSDAVYLVLAIVAGVGGLVGTDIALIRFLTESYRTIAASRLEEIKLLRAQHASLNEAIELGKEDLRNATEQIHQAELETKDRDAEIARLRAMPDTNQMLEVFESHHRENIDRNAAHHRETSDILKTVAATLQEVVGNQGDLQAIVSATLGRPRRSSDPQSKERPA